MRYRMIEEKNERMRRGFKKRRQDTKTKEKKNGE